MHDRLLLATFLTFGWIFIVVFQPVFTPKTDLLVVVALGAFGVASVLVLGSLVSLAVDHRLPPMRNFPSLDIDESCWVAAVMTGVAGFAVMLILTSLLPRSVPQLVTSFLYAAPFWAASMAFLVKAAESEADSTIEY